MDNDLYEDKPSRASVNEKSMALCCCDFDQQNKESILKVLSATAPTSTINGHSTQRPRSPPQVACVCACVCLPANLCGFKFKHNAHLGEVRRRVFSSAQVGQAPHSVARHGQPRRFAKQSATPNFLVSETRENFSNRITRELNKKNSYCSKGTRIPSFRT